MNVIVRPGVLFAFLEEPMCISSRRETVENLVNHDG
jgi:hypothetical protein